MCPSFREIARTMDRLDPPRSLRDLNQRHRWLESDMAKPVSLRRIATRHSNPETKYIRFLSYNTYLLRVDIGPFHPHSAAALDERAQEIGQMIKKEYDLAALCEVWQNDLKDKILEAWRGNPWISDAAEPSGLIVISTDNPILAANNFFHEFEEKGDWGRDADAHAGKGVVWTRVLFGPHSPIDLFNTHLFSGGGLIGSPSPEEILRIQKKQLEEFESFYKAKHFPEHVAIITGDFNIDGRDEATYAALTEVMTRLNMVDVWQEHWGNSFPSMKTGYQAAPNLGGYTNTEHPDRDQAAQHISLRMPLVGPPDPRDNRFCLEPMTAIAPGPTGKTEKRLDYIFIERPQASHYCTVDVARIRRRSFRRSHPTEGLDYLSDHLGLDVTLIVSPKE